MRYTQVQTPRGVRDYLGAEAAAKRAAEEAFRETFAAWGYEEVITPTVEFFEALALSDGVDLAERMFRFFDREGNLLALRPEMTTPIARLVAGRLRDAPKPLRLAYVANVFRYHEPQAGRGREFWQAGVELVGSRSPAADAEVVALAVAALEAAGLENFRLDIGQVGYFHGLLEEAGLPKEDRQGIRQALLRADYVALEEALAGAEFGSGAAVKAGEALRRLPRLKGGVEILDEAEALSDHPGARAAVANLRALVDVLDDYGVAHRVGIDLGMIKDLDYYTGMVLEAYSEALGFPLCTGGRYDGLLGRFGYDCPATGFVVGVERVLVALQRQRQEGPGGPEGGPVRVGPRWLVGAPEEAARPAALAAVGRLRAAGEKVAVDLEGMGEAQLREDAARRGIEAVVVFTADGQGPEVFAPEGLRALFQRLVGQ